MFEKPIKLQMQNALLSILFFTSFSWGQTSSNKVFIGFNGGGFEYENYSDFEESVAAFSNELGANGFEQKILNAGGSSGRKLSSLGEYPERDSSGNVLLQTNQLPGDIATEKNLSQAIASSKKAASVVIVFEDHGTEEGVAAWQGQIVSNAKIQSIDKDFPSTSLVRRIQLTCFSGASLGSQPNTAVKTSAEILEHYPVNRCAFASSREDEYSSTATGWADEIKKNPSLKDLKGFFQNDVNYSASPRLTSDEFEETIVQHYCSENELHHLCASSTLSKTQKSALSMTCKTYSDSTQELRKKSSAVEWALKKYISSQDQLMIDWKNFVDQKYPEKSKLAKQYQSQQEQQKILAQDLRENTASPSGDSKQAADFIRAKYASIAVGKSRLDSNPLIFVDDPDLAEFKKKYPHDSENMDNFGALASARQTERKTFQANQEAARAQAVQSLLNAASDGGPLKNRWENIKKCESAPLSADSL
jgi:hypothetical protein